MYKCCIYFTPLNFQETYISNGHKFDLTYPLCYYFCALSPPEKIRFSSTEILFLPYCNNLISLMIKIYHTLTHFWIMSSVNNPLKGIQATQGVRKMMGLKSRHLGSMPSLATYFVFNSSSPLPIN